MEMVDFIPICGNIRYKKRKIYHKLIKRGKEVSNCTKENVAMLGSKNFKIIEMMAKVQPKIMRLSTNIWKGLRDGYVHGMLYMAEHVAHLNNGEICYFKKIHHDGDDVDVLYRKAS
ncbi:unnamed protein product [Trifolium pratense]|uniref:Uncharacterized protein n=1 Tax=Trifolium pratense TaxID=57577 RepID=A0ACB0IWW9_TRIPR|nr:unnamed protein product [Trifolium pratense]